MTSKDAYWILNGLPGLGPISLNVLLEAFGDDPVAALGASKGELAAIQGLTRRAVDSLINADSLFDLNQEKMESKRLGVDFIERDHPQYPSALREIHDPPIGLYVRGEYRFSKPQVAIIGSRRTTLYGQSIAREFAQELSGRGFCVVSGMARGIDTCAHQGALEAKDGNTVAVLGCGIDIVYPPENIGLYRDIGNSGAVVSEFTIGRKADRQTFPMRNRLVSGMSRAIIVVESDVSGGSMITARFAGEQGRLVCAVPGRIDQKTSEGCNRLIKDGALLLSSVDELMSELEYESQIPKVGTFSEIERKSDIDDLSELEIEALAFFKGGEIVDADRLGKLTNQSSPEISSTLLMLELKGYVAKRLDGAYEAISTVR